MVRAVHGFEEVFLALFGRGDGLEGVFAVFGIVAGGDVEVLRPDVWRDDLLVAEFLLDLLQELFEAQAQCGAFGKPHGEAFTHEVGEHEEFHFLTDLAVVAALGFLEQGEIFVQELLLGEGDAIDAGEHGAFLVAAPVGGADGHDFASLDGGRAQQVRSTAEVGEATLRVGGDVTVFEVGNEFVLVGLSAIAEEFECIRLGNGSALHSFFPLGDFDHFLFDLGEVFFADHDTLGGHHIIVESVFDGGTDTKLGAGPEFLNGFSHEVGRGVPEGVFAFGVLPFVEGDFGVFSDGSVQFNGLSVHADGEHLLC